MSDDLVKRLRDWEHVWPQDLDEPEGGLYIKAADRIEELERAVRYEADIAQQALDSRKELQAKLAKAVEALRYYAQDDDDGGWLANKTLAELSSNTTGGKDE